METAAHIVIALSSLIFSSYVLVRGATRRRVYGSYGLIAATVASGVYVALIVPNAAIHACISGGVYLAVVSVMTAYANKRHSATTVLSSR